MRLGTAAFVCLGVWLSSAPSARATFTVTGVAADQNTFIGLVNTDTQGGTWALNGTNQLVFTANGNALNVFATQLNNLNNANNVRTVSVMQDFPGVLVGAFGPTFTPAQPAGTQLVDLGDIQAFTATTAAQPQPLLDTRGSVLIHELAEVNADGGAANFNASHTTGINVENTILASQGGQGMRVAGGTFATDPAAPGANFTTFTMRVPFQTTAAVAAAGGQPALALGAMYNEVIRGRITGAVAPFNFGITNVARGLVDTGVSYDGTGYSVSISSIGIDVVPEPSAFALLLIGGTGLLGRTLTRRRAA